MSVFVVDGRVAVHSGTTPLAFVNGNKGYRGSLPLFRGVTQQPLVPPAVDGQAFGGGGGSPFMEQGQASFSRAERLRVERLRRERRRLRREILEAIDGPEIERLPPAPKTETALTEAQETIADTQPDLLPARLALANVQIELIQLEARLTRRQELQRQRVEEERLRAMEEQEIRDIINALLLLGAI